MANSCTNSTAPFNFIWAIENCRQPPYLKLQSPTFTVDSIEKTKWRLILHVNQHCVLGYIKRQIDRSALKSMELNFELAVLAADGKRANEQKDVCFRINPHSKIVKLIENNVLSDRKAEFLPNDTLTVWCQIRRRDVGISTPDLCFARTQLLHERLCFIWAVESFSSLLPGHRRNHSFQTTINCGFTLTLNLYLDHDDDMYHIEIHALGGRYCGIKTEISAMDTEGKTVHSVAVGCQIHLNELKMSFPPFIGRNELMAHKDRYLLNDKLLLKCEFDIFAGTSWNQIEYCLQSSCPYVDGYAVSENNNTVDENFISSNENCFLKKRRDVDGHVMPENIYSIDKNSDSCNDYCSLKNSLKYVEEEGLFSDIILRNDIQSFPVHKNILSARCPNFEALFRCGMLNKDSNVVELQNLDGSTLRHLLLYIYTDTLDNLRWKDALDLFSAAADYELTDLKRRCSAFLKAYLSKSNVFDVLSLAGEHQDENLIIAAKDFILQHDTEFNSTENVGNVFKKCRKRISLGNN
ncbi:hypothetical protein AVEN_75797-1 [Araneus ventricosus]|uniref:BTB domain-containing protein n=1 Tax=Araneus ventricosus TaxID=182803 RepID=A0A4Y2K5Q1_ARAVE|nr:hypothetical protein AVEN_75797-1 [Araneus ventricosus]